MADSVLFLIDDVIHLLEAGIPANPASDENSKLADQLQDDLATYFNKVEKSVTPELLSRLYNEYVKESDSDIKNVLDTIIKLFTKDLVTMVKGHVVKIFLHGASQMIAWGKTKTGIPITYEGPPMRQAIKYAEKHCAELVTGMNAETKERLAGTISRAIEQKRGVPGLSRDIRNAFEDMTKARSEMIARTETCDALQQSFLNTAREMGIDGKEWVVTDPCDICQENADAGVIELEEDFPSGDDAPPAHPNCRCALAPARLGRK